MGKHYWKRILPRVLELEVQGYTHRMAAEELGYSYEQIKKLVERYHKNQRKETLVAVKRGRPRTRPIKDEEAYQKRIKQLEKETELLRSFLQAAGRM